MHHVFVSYSRADAEWVRGLVKRLEQRRIDVWIDTDDIPVTVPWLAEVRDSVDESALFLRCDSPAFRGSASCSAEVGFAEHCGKPQYVVSVGTDLDWCAGQIMQTLRQVAPGRAQRTELRVLARDWDRGGRPRARLVSRKARRRLSEGLASPPPASSTEQAFLRASKSRTRWRTAIATAVVSLIMSSAATIVIFQTLQDKVNNVNSQLAIDYSQEHLGLNQVARDPYSGLQAAAGDGGDESESKGDVISEALLDPTPDDAFAVPGARSFVTRPVNRQVVVAAGRGREWQRSSDPGAAGRAATELPGSVPPAASGGAPSASSADGVTASGDGHSGQVRVLRNGHLWRIVSFDAAPAALAFSPDGRFLAATIGEQVEIADVRTAQLRNSLRGATGRLLDVAWSADGTHVWALDSARVFSWLAGDAVTLADDPSADFSAVLPAASPQSVWIVSAHQLTKISVASGKQTARITVPDTLVSAGASPDGTLALASGDHYLWVIPLSGAGQPRPVTVPGCPLGRPAFASATTAYLPCLGGSLLRLTLPSAAVTATITVPGESAGNGVFGAAADPGSGTVYVGDEAGYLYAVHGLAAVPIQASECDAEIEHIAVAPGDRAVLPVGSGSGQGTCTAIGLRAGRDPASQGSWQWNHVIELQQQSIYASAVAFSAGGGSFAIGYSNGTITMHPTLNLAPSLVDATADGMIRGMLTLPDGDLIAATDTGMVQRLRLCDGCISNAALAKVAAGRLKLDERLGLVRQTRVAAGS